MRRRLLSLLLTLAAFVAVIVGVAPNASAACTGPGCDSGWQGTTVYYVGSHTNVNIDVHWTADAYNTRTIYFSGSNCSFTDSCVRLQSVSLYYSIPPSGGWILIATYTPGPSYGSYSYRVISPGPSTARHFVVAGRDQYGHIVNSPVVTN